jgi:hypothetical protein
VGLTFVKAVASATMKNQLDQETRAKVEQFYERDDISWQAPGRKDHVIIREKGEHGKTTKLAIQSRYLLMSLAEAHRLYADENREKYKVGRSKFCELRPKHVKLFDAIPHNVCVCQYHENVRLLLVSLKDDTNLQTDIKKVLRQNDV